MSPLRSLLPLAACLLPFAPIAAQDGPETERAGFPPLSELPRVRGPQLPLKERLFRSVARATRPIPHLRRLVAPTRGQLRLGVVLVRLSDSAQVPFTPVDYEEALFSRDSYRRTPTGEPAHGSMRDYFLENSSGALDLTGRVHDWVQLRASRAELEPALLTDVGARRSLFHGAIDAVRAREGLDAFRGVDGLVFVVAGDQARERGSVLWPHSGVTFHRGRAFRYYLIHSGARRFEPIGVHCHEMGHVLGILDKYGVGPGTGLGQWCLMAQGGHGGRERGVDLEAPTQPFGEKLRGVVQDQLEQLRERLGGARAPRSAGKARPLHLCAVCKHRLDWSRPTVIDPRRTTSFRLAPVEEDAQQVAQVLLDPRGRETLYLEYRTPTGFDADLPQAGLLVWRAGSPTAIARTFVPFEQVELLPAHGVRSIDAPLRAPKQVPFPQAGASELIAGGTLPGSWRVRIDRIAVVDGALQLRVGVAN